MKMNIIFKKLVFVILIFSYCINQNDAHALFIRKAKSKSQITSENLASNLLPSFRYHRNNIELNQKNSIDLLLESNSRIVKVEVIKAEGIGLSIDENKLINDGLIIVRPKRLRKSPSSKEKIQTKLQKNNVAVFNLTKPETQPLIIDAIDFKIFKVIINGILPGVYTLKATIDKNETTQTIVFTKSPFRIDTVSPSIIDRGIETIITIIGKGLDALTQVSIDKPDVKVLELESLDDSVLRVKILAKENASPGFRNITIASPLIGKTATLVNGLYLSAPTLGVDVTIMDGMDGSTGPEGPQGLQGPQGLSGKGICENSNDSIKVFTNTLQGGSKATTTFDPSTCSFFFGIPQGLNGSDGLSTMGLCIDRNATPTTITTSLSAGSMATVQLDPQACTITYGIPQGDTGTQGNTGLAGISCWDLDADRVNDPNEDINMDGQFNSADCQGAANIPPIEQVISSWSSLSDEQNHTTTSGDMTRMVKIPRFIHGGIIYGGFWIDKYEASRADATMTAEGTSSVPISKRDVVPWTSINLASSQANGSSSNRQVSGLGSCHLIKMKEWHALYLLGRYAKEKGISGATSTNGWNERGNTRSGKDGRNSSSFKCADDPNENSGGDGRCLTGTGYKSWGHLLDGTATTNPKSGSNPGEGSLGSSADSVKDDGGGTGADTLDGDLQVYDLVGNVKEWIDFTVTRTSGDTKVDSPYQGAGIEIPFSGSNKFYDFKDISDDPNFQGLGLPKKSGSDNNLTDVNGGANDGKGILPGSDAQFGTTRGGAFNNSNGTDSRSPLQIDLSTSTTTAESSRGFRVTCDLAQGQ